MIILATNFIKIAAAASLLGMSIPRRARFRQAHPIVHVRPIAGSSRPMAEVLAGKTVKQLRALVTAMKIKGRSKARRKADLIALIPKHRPFV